MKILVLGDFQGVFSNKLKTKLKKEKFDLVVGVGDYGGIKEWRPYIMKQLSLAKKGLRLSPEKYFGKKRLKELLKKEYENTKNVFREINFIEKKVIIIFGNSDDEWYKYPFESSLPAVKKSRVKFLKNLKNIKIINYGKTQYRGFTFVGFGGYMDIDAYFDKKEWKDDTEERSKSRIKRREKSKKKLFKILKDTSEKRIFIFHYPPKGVFDIIKDRKDNPMNGKSSGIGFFTEAIKKYKPLLVFCGHMHEYQGMKKLNDVPIINPGDAERSKYAIVDLPESKNRRIKVKFI